MMNQLASTGQWEQRWCLYSSAIFGEDGRDAGLKHKTCAQMNMFRGYFLLKQIRGGQYNMPESSKRERC